MASRFSFEASQGRSGRRRLLYATLLILALLALDLLTGGSIRSLVRSGASGLWSMSASVRGGITGSGALASRSSLAHENALLREQLERMTERAAAYSSLQQENEILRALLRLADDQQGITAPIVSSVRSSPYGTFLIGAGQGDAVQPGSLVLTEGGFVAGRVSEVHARTTLVTEVFAGGGEIDANINGVVVMAEGRGGGNARVELPRDATVQVGDPVVAPQLGGRPIGVVGRIESDPSSASQTVYINLPVNLAALRYVYVVPAQ